MLLSAIVLFQLVTLPVEFDASKRAPLSYASATTATPAATSSAPAARAPVTGSWSTTRPSAAAITTLLSRTAATGPGSASRSAARTRR